MTQAYQACPQSGGGGDAENTDEPMYGNKSTRLVSSVNMVRVKFRERGAALNPHEADGGGVMIGHARIIFSYNFTNFVISLHAAAGSALHLVRT